MNPQLKTVHFGLAETPGMVDTVYIEPGRKSEVIPTRGAKEWDLAPGMAKDCVLHISSDYWTRGQSFELSVRFRKMTPNVRFRP